VVDFSKLAHKPVPKFLLFFFILREFLKEVGPFSDLRASLGKSTLISNGVEGNVKNVSAG
jgi:hypothetical protein